jgi:glycosyltransferase involved in cell wall biosynthesis
MLEKEGVSASMIEIPRFSRARWDFIRSLAEADTVVLHRKLFNWLELAFIRRNARSLVFDFDDAVMVRDPFRSSPASRRRSGRFRNVVSKADGVIAGNAHLADLALEHGASCEVRIIPTGVDLGRYMPANATGQVGAVLGWIGQASTLGYLAGILPVLDGLAPENPGMRLRVICDAFPENTAIPVERRTWSEETEAEDLAGIDIGLMPLSDDPWSRGKCGFKILQYYAAGKPVVASPVGVNSDLVVPGETGFLAEEPGEWAEAITTLASDPDLARKMGETGRELVVNRSLTLEDYAVSLAAFLREITART